MDTFISIIGLASFIYFFILGAKTLKAKNHPTPSCLLTRTEDHCRTGADPSVR